MKIKMKKNLMKIIIQNKIIEILIMVLVEVILWRQKSFQFKDIMNTPLELNISLQVGLISLDQEYALI